MLNRTSLYGFAHERLWQAGGADFDGTNDNLERSDPFTGISDGPEATFSCWFRLDGGDGATQHIFNGSTQRTITRTSANVISVDFRGTGRVTMSTAGTHTTSTTWKHLLVSFDTNTVGARHIYITDVADTSGVTFTAGNVPLTDDFGIGAASGGGSRFNGCLAEVFFHNDFIDISVEANRRKFITATGRPEYLGALGERPFGTRPVCYVARRTSQGVNVFNNVGTGGVFTLVGTLDASSSNP